MPSTFIIHPLRFPPLPISSSHTAPDPPPLSVLLPLTRSFFLPSPPPSSSLAIIFETISSSLSPSHPLLPSIAASLTAFLTQIRALTPPEQTHIHLELRLTQPNTFGNIPRWHVDGEYWPGGAGWKYGITLLGEGTLFLESELAQEVAGGVRAHDLAWGEREKAGTVDEEFEDWYYTADALSRSTIAEKLKNETIFQPKEGEMVAWRWGAGGAVHSEPRMDGEGGRVFVVVLPGTEGEIEVRRRELEG